MIKNVPFTNFNTLTRYNSLNRYAYTLKWSNLDVITFRQASQSNYGLISRSFHLSPYHFEDSSKVESTVKALKQKSGTENKVLTKPMSNVELVTEKQVQRGLGKRIWDELVHYYHGFRLLFIDIRVSTRLFGKILQGSQLSRREHEQLVRTVADLFRLVPFSVFIIVPFLELLLPVFVKLFPNMLPSTFQTASDRVRV